MMRSGHPKPNSLRSCAPTRRLRTKRSPANNWRFTDRVPQFPIWRNFCPTRNCPRGRTAIEAIPGDEADEALRAAADSLDGRLLVGMINSIGVRRDTGAVDALIKRLQDTDANVASAAAVALGRIGNPAAATALRQSLAAAPAQVRSAIAEGCVLCAERLHADGNAAEAIAIYDEVRNADLPEQRIIEATRGAILARNQEGIPLLLEQLRSS